MTYKFLTMRELAAVKKPTGAYYQREQYLEGYRDCLRELTELKKRGFTRESERLNILWPYAAGTLKMWVSKGGTPWQRPPVPFSGTSWYALRNVVFARDGRFCEFCNSQHDLEIDHILPVAKGGVANLSNLRVLCKSCNLGRNVTGGRW
jgi:hypothetical protein